MAPPLHRALLGFILFLSLPPSSLPAPILAPNISHCHLPYNLPAQEPPFNCCAPPSHIPPIPFQLNHTSQPFLRLRRPAHSVDREYAEKLSLAYSLMKALPPDDPRSFIQQANIHCAYCNTVYTQLNSTLPFQVHGCWLFFSFHRWYLYFHERILSKLLGDDSFALTFWNYDHPNGSTIPRIFLDYPELVDQLRGRNHFPPSVVAIDYAYDTDDRTPDEQLKANADTMYRVMVSGVTTPFRFFGQPYRAGDAEQPGYGTVEVTPHNTVHLWVGDPKQIGWKDMGTFYAAARDPIFYAHHANLDRFWDVWKSMEGNQDLDDPDYLDSEFAFYNEDAELVNVKVRDSLDSSKLGYTYEDVENPWMSVIPVAQSHGVASLSENDTLCKMGELLLIPCSVLVARDRQAALTGEETLVLEGIELQRGRPSHIDVFLNLPTANESTTLGCPEYAGRFSTVPMFYTNITVTSIRLDISYNVRALNLTLEDSLVVTIVPRVRPPGAPVALSGIQIEYESPVEVTAESSQMLEL